MKTLLFTISVFCFLLSALAQPYGVYVGTNGTLIGPTNFFRANTNRWYPLLPPGSGGGTNGLNGTNGLDGAAGTNGLNGLNGSAWVPLYVLTSVSNFVNFSNSMQFIATGGTNIAFFGPSNQPANPTAASVEILITNTSASSATVSTFNFQPLGAATTNFATLNGLSSMLYLFNSEGNGTYTFLNSVAPGMLGAQGTNATITITNTIVGAAGSNPSVTNLGNNLNAVLQFTLPLPTNGVNGVNGTNGLSGTNFVLGQLIGGSNGAAAVWMVGMDAGGNATTNPVPSGGAGGGLADAPTNGQTYWRNNGAWLPVPSPLPLDIYLTASNLYDSGLLTHSMYFQGSGGTYTNGKVGTAIYLAGAAHISQSDASAPITLFGFSVSLWFQTSTNGGLFCLGNSAGTGGNTDMYGYIRTNGYAGFAYNDSGFHSQVAESGFVVTNNGWHHYLLTLDNTAGSKLYMDGTLTGSTNVANGITAFKNFNWTPYWRFGWTDAITAVGGKLYFTGAMQDIRVYGLVLNSLQVSNIFNAGVITNWP
jgi:hypothetical protein